MKVHFVYSQLTKETAIFMTDVSWLSITEDHITVHCRDDSLRQFKLRRISKFICEND